MILSYFFRQVLFSKHFINFLIYIALIGRLIRFILNPNLNRNQNWNIEKLSSVCTDFENMLLTIRYNWHGSDTHTEKSSGGGSVQIRPFGFQSWCWPDDLTWTWPKSVTFFLAILCGELLINGWVATGYGGWLATSSGGWSDC